MNNPSLDKEEFLALSDQKAADWRAITQMSTAFLAFAGALFAAGVGQRAAFVVILTPVPLLFGVFHMIRNARLQLQMITYLAAFSPFEGVSWERDIAAVRPRFWKGSTKPAWIEKGQKRYADNEVASHLLRSLAEPSAWHTWIEIALVVGIMVDLVPLFADGYEAAWLAFGVGIALLLAGAWVCVRGGSKIESTRKSWEGLWATYSDELESGTAPR